MKMSLCHDTSLYKQDIFYNRTYHVSTNVIHFQDNLTSTIQIAKQSMSTFQ